MPGAGTNQKFGGSPVHCIGATINNRHRREARNIAARVGRTPHIGNPTRSRESAPSPATTFDDTCNGDRTLGQSAVRVHTIRPARAHFARARLHVVLTSVDANMRPTRVAGAATPIDGGLKHCQKQRSNRRWIHARIALSNHLARRRDGNPGAYSPCNNRALRLYWVIDIWPDHRAVSPSAQAGRTFRISPNIDEPGDRPRGGAAYRPSASPATNKDYD
jgi:hypothetical protein